MAAISKLEPHRSMYLRGFDRRGSAASINNASASGFTVSGCWSDQADFAVLMLFDADDQFGHMFTSRYLPDFSLASVTLDFDLAITGCMSPISTKYQSVPWGKISYIKTDETSGAVALPAPTSTTGGSAASATLSASGAASYPSAYDRVQLVYLGNVVFDYVVNSGDDYTTVARALATQINASGYLTATYSGSSFTVSAPVGRDGNSVELLAMNKTSTCFLTVTGSPISSVKLTGGADPTSMHFHLDFSALGLSSARQLWLTLAPGLNYDSGTVNPSLVAFAPTEFSAVFSNWTIADPGGVTPLKIAGAGSVTIDSRDSWTAYAGTGWSEQAGWYVDGFAHQSANAGDTVTVKYSCQFTHNLYLGTALTASGGQFTTTVDGVAVSPVSCYANTGSPIYARRLMKTSVAAGAHTVVLTVAAGSYGNTCLFDFIQAAVLSDPQAPAVTYSHVNCACDYDTDQTYKVAPARALWILSQAGFAGDIDLYSGVFFALKRSRNGGNFHQATVTISAGSSGFNWGSLFGDGDAMFLQVGGNAYGDGIGTAFGAAVYPTDSVTTLAQRLVNAVNALFVGICAAPTSTAGQFTITSLSPINGFTLFSNYIKGTGGNGAANPSTGSITVTGDIGTGNEGTWQVDPTQSSPLNRAFHDYLADFAGLVHAAGQTLTVAFSQELLAPPDVNTSAGAWTQRFPDGTQVLTSTGFGSWGAGVVESVSGSGPQTIQQTGHGYITGNTVHVAQGSNGAVWAAVVVDANHWQPGALVSGTAFTIAAGATTLIDLQTIQCTFNPATVTAYLAGCYKQAAGILAGVGLTPWLQFGEVGWWFFSRVQNLAVGYASYTAPVSIGTAAPHTLATGNRVIVAGVQGDTAANGDQTIAVTDPTHFTENGTSGNGSYVGGTGTVSGGGMAFYDAWAVAAATSALGRTLANFQHQDDDPTVNSGADAAFLASCIKTHIDAIRTAVLAVQSGAKFELLWPYDTNYPTCYWTNALPYPQGGRLNRAVNLPAAYLTKAGSGLDRLKMEALSWGLTYRNLTNAAAAIAFPWTVGTWSRDNTAYLVPWSNGGCAWSAEYLSWLNAVLTALPDSPAPIVNFWAVDHMTLLSWPLPLPKPSSGTATA